MSAFKKSLLVAGVAMILSNNVFADEGHGIVKFKGEVISAPCSIKPGDEDLTVNLGEVADTVLKSDQKSLLSLSLFTARLHVEPGWNHLFKSEGYFHHSEYYDGSD